MSYPAAPCDWDEMPFWIKRGPRIIYRPPRPILARLEEGEPGVPLGDRTGRDLYAHTEPIAYADAEQLPSWPWARYMSALGELLDVVAIMVRDDADGNPGWTHLASPARCPPPWLRVLAQWSGIRRWDQPEEALRDIIGPTAPGLWRGTRAALLATIRQFLPVQTDYSFDDIIRQDRPMAWWTLGDPPGSRQAREEVRELHGRYVGLVDAVDGGQPPTWRFVAWADGGGPDTETTLAIDGNAGEDTITLGARGARLGSRDTAADFHGGWMSVNYDRALNAPQFTVEAWARPSTLDGTGGIVSSQGPERGFALIRSGADVHLMLGQGYAMTDVIAPEAVAVGDWTHLAASYDGAVARVYVNGREAASEAVSYEPEDYPQTVLRVARYDFPSLNVLDGGAPDSEPTTVADGGLPARSDDVLTIDGDPPALHGPRLFDGRVDEVILYDYALDPRRIEVHRCRALWIDPPADIDRFVGFDERFGGDPYALRVWVYAFLFRNFPHNVDQIRAALEAAKPAGIVPFTYEVRRGQAWFMLERRFDTWAHVRAHYENWHEMYTDETELTG